MQSEDRALRGYTLVQQAASSENEGLIEELFREFPMVRSRPPANVGLAEQRGDKHPGVYNDLFASSKIHRHGNIEPTSYPSKPTLLSPPRQKFRGDATINPEGVRRYVDGNHFLAGAKDGSQA